MGISSPPPDVTTDAPYLPSNDMQWITPQQRSMNALSCALTLKM